MRLVVLAATALLSWGPARAASLERAFPEARLLAERLPRPVLRLAAAEVRRTQAEAFLPLMLRKTPIGVSMGFSLGASNIDEWGKFRIEGREFVFLFDDLDKGVRAEGFLFQNVYQMARRTLRVTRLANQDRAEVGYIELLDELSRRGFQVGIGGRTFALFVEEGEPIPASISLISPGGLSMYLRGGLLAGGRITWFFTQGGMDYGVRPEGDQIVFYARSAAQDGE